MVLLSSMCELNSSTTLIVGAVSVTGVALPPRGMASSASCITTSFWIPTTGSGDAVLLSDVSGRLSSTCSSSQFGPDTDSWCRIDGRRGTVSCVRAAEGVEGDTGCDESSMVFNVGSIEGSRSISCTGRMPNPLILFPNGDDVKTVSFCGVDNCRRCSCTCVAGCCGISIGGGCCLLECGFVCDRRVCDELLCLVGYWAISFSRHFSIA